MLDATYLLPIRSDRPHRAELGEYLEEVSRACPVVVVDGSPDLVFDEVHDRWSRFGRHLRPDPALWCANGKVQGVLTGFDQVTTTVTVIADDDVRYSADRLTEIVDALLDPDDPADLVVPQNHFEPTTWHAMWDTGRTLLNRVSGGDFPGTLAVRTAVIRRTGGYDGDVLFENLQLMRTIEAAGGRVLRRPDLYVRRRPPTGGHFLGQRVRQAYDEFARPRRMVAQLAVLPLAAAALRRRPALVPLAVASIVGAAEAGRRRHGGRRFFSPLASLCAPLWVSERAVCSWLALGARALGGARYGDGRLRVAARSVEDIGARLPVDRAIVVERRRSTSRIAG